MRTHSRENYLIAPREGRLKETVIDPRRRLKTLKEAEKEGKKKLA